MKLFGNINGNEGIVIIRSRSFGLANLTRYSSKTGSTISSGCCWHFCCIWITHWWGAVQSGSKFNAYVVRYRG